jgi:hypothetical protein
MSSARDRSSFAGAALVLAMIFGVIFWAGVVWAVVPKNWTIWPTACQSAEPALTASEARSRRWQC